MSVAVLFVCLGNICRSPLAEAALRQECTASDLNIIVDSAGTGDWHAGQPPDERAQAAAARNGLDIGHLRARQVTPADFRDFDHIVALDRQNYRDLRAMQPANARAQLSLLLDHVEGRAGEDVADPYYGEDAAFDQTWSEVTDAARAMRQRLEADAVA
ncbi:low molecular weight protein-tyrosine-phosphatase [Parasphingorhabdus sp.]|uniref:low molecular weight protein-tyrosine-phosphatase n=1 Tax=Parasphingorhabdus sp. TaxID=2709688 RepID=UPI0030014875